MYTAVHGLLKSRSLHLSSLLLFLVSLTATAAHAQYSSTLPSEDFRTQHAVPAGPYSVANTATGTLVTTIPLVHLTGPGGTVMDFTLYHTSAGGSLYSYKGQVARGWRHSFDEGITDNHITGYPPSSTYAQRTSPGGGVSECHRLANNPQIAEVKFPTL